MRKNPILSSLKGLSLLALFLIFGMLANAQLKIGDNPTTIEKSSILELESSRQGLLLPRLADTTSINLLTPPDGMIIYLKADSSLRLRSKGQWKKIADLGEASANWSLTGNSNTDPTKHFMGTLDNKPLVIRTDNQERLRVDAGGNVGIGTTSPTAKLNVDGTVKFENLGAGSTELDVLVLNPDGSVYKRTMSSTAFENAIKSINGLQKQTLSITAASSTTTDTVAVENRNADSTIAIYLPVQDGQSATKPYGFLTLSDWQKIQSAIQTITIGAVATTPDIKGASIDSSGTTRTITLHPADATHPGIVSTDAQTFGGSKTFQDSVAVNGTLTLNHLTTNTSADSVLVVKNGVVEKRQVSSSAFGNAIRSINNNRDTAQAIAFTTNGNDLSVSTNGKDTINLNVPSASLTARGVVTTASQSFAGTKSFQDSVKASKTIIIGSSGNANSTMQVNGSVSMAITRVSGNYAATAADNTILADASTAAVTITLPATSAIIGRIYTIKKIGNGGIDNELTITPAPGSTIEGGTSYKIYNDWTYVTLQTDGTDWYIIKK